MMASFELRPSPIAGTWYPSNPERLARSIDHYLDEAHLPELAGEIVAVIAPTRVINIRGDCRSCLSQPARQILLARGAAFAHARLSPCAVSYLSP